MEMSNANLGNVIMNNIAFFFIKLYFDEEIKQLSRIYIGRNFIVYLQVNLET